ncbi:MAG TPA: CHAD domain-containing protein [Stellaceae bacterium]|nr:CHAD domain-containing protein [Stellaceae bacterium]
MAAILESGLAELHELMRKPPVKPGAVHRLRVASRRLRALLGAFHPYLAVNPLEERLRALSARYTGIREMDVFRAQTLVPLHAVLPHAAGIAEVLTALDEARKDALPQAVESDFPAASPASPMVVKNHPLPVIAEDFLTRHHRRLREALRSVDLDDPASFHRLRIRVKKLRYPAQSFAPLFAAPDTYLDRIIALQEALGGLHDAAVGLPLLDRLPATAQTRAMIQGWLAHEASSWRQRFTKCAEDFRRVKPFW